VVSTLAHGMVNDTNGTDCWHHRTDSGRSVMAGIRCRSTQNSNWKWWVYHLSDSSRQWHSVANSTVDWLTVFVKSYHSQHTLHELRARRLSKIHSTVSWEVLRNYARSLNTVAVTWPQSHQQTGENRSETWSAASQCLAAVATLSVQTVIGTNTYADM